MRYLKYLPLLLMAALFTFTSCEKESMDDQKVVTSPITPKETTTSKLVSNLRTTQTEEGLLLGCITIAYPFELALENGSSISINTEEDFTNIVLDTTFCCIIDFVYPLQIELEDGTTATANDGEELGELFAACIPDTGWTTEDFPAFLINLDNSCYILDYPINLRHPDGTIFTANDEAEFIDLLATHELLFFEFPITLIDSENDTTFIANNVDDIFELFATCETISHPCDSVIFGSGSLACYTIVFPVDLILLDSTVVTAADENEFNNLLFNGNVAGFAYPLSLIDEDGSVLVANDDNELFLLFNQCDGIVVGGDDPAVQLLFLFSNHPNSPNGCYEINYPITVADIDGNSIVLNDAAAYEEALETIFLVSVEYPVSITLNDGGGVVDINSFDDLHVVISNCE
ncbi:MAG: hypothetical protein AAF990_18700 [Bacteroidota bacterium]